MDLKLTPEEQAFRTEVRTFIRDNLPKETRERLRLGYTATKPQIVEWLKILNAKGGWSVPGWPKEWGGPGWTTVQKMIFTEEVYMAPAPEPLSFNSTMIGPVLMQAPVARLSATPATVKGPAPLLGEANAEVYADGQSEVLMGNALRRLGWKRLGFRPHKEAVDVMELAL